MSNLSRERRTQASFPLLINTGQFCLFFFVVVVEELCCFVTDNGFQVKSGAVFASVTRLVLLLGRFWKPLMAFLQALIEGIRLRRYDYSGLILIFNETIWPVLKPFCLRNKDVLCMEITGCAGPTPTSCLDPFLLVRRLRRFEFFLSLPVCLMKAKIRDDDYFSPGVCL